MTPRDYRLTRLLASRHDHVDLLAATTCGEGRPSQRLQRGSLARCVAVLGVRDALNFEDHGA